MSSAIALVPSSPAIPRDADVPVGSVGSVFGHQVQWVTISGQVWALERPEEPVRSSLDAGHHRRVPDGQVNNVSVHVSRGVNVARRPSSRQGCRGGLWKLMARLRLEGRTVFESCAAAPRE